MFTKPVVETTIAGTKIMQKAAHDYLTSVHDMKEAQVKSALITMGWKPPKERMNFLQKLLFKLAARVSTND